MRWNYISIPRFRPCSRSSSGKYKEFHHTLYWARDYFSLSGSKLNTVSKRGHWTQRTKFTWIHLWHPGKHYRYTLKRALRWRTFHSWWRHDMETFPRYWPVVRRIHWSPAIPLERVCNEHPWCLLGCSLNKWMDKQWSYRWFETPRRLCCAIVISKGSRCQYLMRGPLYAFMTSSLITLTS